MVPVPKNKSWSQGLVRVCGAKNPRGRNGSFATCGAARWDGEEGQLRARVAAALQTLRAVQDPGRLSAAQVGPLSGRGED